MPDVLAVMFEVGHPHSICKHVAEKFIITVIPRDLGLLPESASSPIVLVHDRVADRRLHPHHHHSLPRPPKSLSLPTRYRDHHLLSQTRGGPHLYGTLSIRSRAVMPFTYVSSHTDPQLRGGGRKMHMPKLSIIVGRCLKTITATAQYSGTNEHFSIAPRNHPICHACHVIFAMTRQVSRSSRAERESPHTCVP
jgi:hypothetical protein